MGSVHTFSRGFFWFSGWAWGEGAMWEDLSLEEYVMGVEIFNEKGAGFSSITIKKKQWKNKHENVFSIESKGVALQLKTNRDYYAY